MKGSINIKYTLNNTIIVPSGISSVLSQTELINFRIIKQDLYEITLPPGLNYTLLCKEYEQSHFLLFYTVVLMEVYILSVPTSLF